MLKGCYPYKIDSARPDSQPSKRCPQRGDMNMTSQVKNETNATINELLELGVQLIGKVVTDQSTII